MYMYKQVAKSNLAVAALNMVPSGEWVATLIFYIWCSGQDFRSPASLCHEEKWDPHVMGLKSLHLKQDFDLFECFCKV